MNQIINQIKQGQARTLSFEPIQGINEEGRILRLSFSSEAPVDMGWDIESLSHAPGAMRVGERQTSMPLLFNHNRDDILGVVENVSTENGKGYATVRFAKTERGDEVLGLIRDGILRNVSFMYRVFKYERAQDGSGVVAVDWEAYEISIVTVPADPNVGVGRQLNEEKGAAGPAALEEDGKTVEITDEESIMENIEVTRAEAVQAERARTKEITALCAAHNIDAEKRDVLIENGASIAEARAAVLDVLKARGAVKPLAAEKPSFEAKDMKGYSLVRAINAVVSGDWTKAGLEREVSRECARKAGKETMGFFMPTSLRSSDQLAGTADIGGDIVATNLLADNFIDMLRNNAVVMQLGAKVLSGLVGNVAIPRQTDASTTYWIAEDEGLTSSAIKFDQLLLTPKTIGAISQMSRQLLLQSTPDIEMLLRNDIAKQLALGIDLAALQGDGTSGQPTGIINTDGIGTVSYTGTYDDIIDLETEVATANADVASMAYVANAAMIGALKKLVDNDGRPLWFTAPGVAAGTPGQLNGYNVYRSNQVPNNTIIFGNFSDMIIGEWGSLEILPNVYGDGYASGAVQIRALQTIDIGLRHAESFAVATGS